MSRTTAYARLAAAYARHQVARRVKRRRPQLDRLLETYAPDRIRPLTADERAQLPAMSACILCGLCALAARRHGSVRLPDLASGRLRSLDLLQPAAADLEGEPADLEAAAAACPMGVPLPQVAAMVARLSHGS